MNASSSAPPLRFRFRGAEQVLPFGATFGVPAREGFTDTPPNEVQDIIAAVRGGRPWREEISARFRQERAWLHDIILSPKRSTFLTTTAPSLGDLTLDIGCGWGQLTLPIARNGGAVVALEPVAERLGFVEAAALQDGCAERIAFIGADYLDCEFEPAFSTILSIGVLEWAGAFQGEEDPQGRQQRFLQKIRRDLKPGGTAIIGIENRMGLKYLLGCPDDHIGVPGIACLPADLARRRWQEHSGHPLRSFTYSDVELTQRLRDAGFPQVEFFAAFPDYKLPEAIVSLDDGGKRLNEMILDGLNIAEHNGYNGQRLDPTLQETLLHTYRSLAEQRIAHHFAPSFFVRATSAARPRAH
ncbi:MAG: methyltransferase domain-containing protein [Opitutaceae bacterium]